MSREMTSTLGVVAGIVIILAWLSLGVAAGCNSSRSVRHLIGPSELLVRLRASAEETAASPLFAQGTFDEEEIRYLGRTAAPSSFDLVLMTTTWGEACRTTRRLLIFDNYGVYLGSYTGLSAVPTRLRGSALFFPVQPQLGDRIEFSAPLPPPLVRLDGELLSFESAVPGQP